jgi:hypothetical protein
VVSCTFDSAGLAPEDASLDRGDQAVLELGVSTGDQLTDDGGSAADVTGGADGAADATVSDQLARDGDAADQLAPDQLVPDQLVPDQLVPDQLVPDQQATKPPCATTYGGVSGFIQLCSQTATECTFYYSNGSCDSKCQAGGGTCIKAAAEQNNSCTPSSSTACDYVHGDGLCTCTR